MLCSEMEKNWAHPLLNARVTRCDSSFAPPSKIYARLRDAHVDALVALCGDGTRHRIYATCVTTRSRHCAL